jgi:hypothetical protein
MQQFVNDFFTVNCIYYINAFGTTNNAQYVDISKFNSVQIINTGLIGCLIGNKSFLLYPNQRITINGDDHQLLFGNLIIEFFTAPKFAPPYPLGQLLFIRKKYI